jgi:heme-degrading monooxygenase HmoA
MFKEQVGILSVNVLIKEDKSLVLTYWNNKQDIVRMEKNALYILTVNKIIQQGFLTGPQHVEIFDLAAEYDLK